MKQKNTGITDTKYSLFNRIILNSREKTIVLFLLYYLNYHNKLYRFYSYFLNYLVNQ